MFKKIIILVTCCLISLLPCISFYNFSFAEEEPTWHDVEDETMFTAAMKAYMKVNNNVSTVFSFTNYNDPIVRAIVSWSYPQWKRAAATQGYDLTQIQKNIKYRVANNDTLQFLYSGSYLETYNKIVTQYCIDNNIPIQDQSFNRQLSTEFIQDDDENIAFIWHLPSKNAGSTFNSIPVMKYGTFYRFEGEHTYLQMSADEHIQYQLTLNQTTKNYWLNKFTYRYNKYLTAYQSSNSSNTDYRMYYSDQNDTTTYVEGGLIFYRWGDDEEHLSTNIAFGPYLNYREGVNDKYYWNDIYQNSDFNNSATQAAIDIAKDGAPSIPLTNGNDALVQLAYDGADAAAKAIKYIQDQDDDKEPDVDPEYKGGEPNFPKPSKPSIPVGFVNNMPITITLPDLDDLIPDSVPSIPHGFSIPGLRYKFPFCIPFDMIAVYEVLDQTPEAPHFETEINFATFTYDLDIDLEEYNSYMVHIRNYFLILYIFGLLFITPKLLKA